MQGGLLKTAVQWVQIGLAGGMTDHPQQRETMAQQRPRETRAIYTRGQGDAGGTNQGQA